MRCACRSLPRASCSRPQDSAPLRNNREARARGQGLQLSLLRCALGWMRESRPRVFGLNLCQAKARDTVGRQRDVVVAFSSMANQHPLFLFKIFKSWTDVGIGIFGRAMEDSRGQNARLASLLEKVDHVALDL